MESKEKMPVTFVEKLDEPLSIEGNPKIEEYGPFDKGETVFLPKNIAKEMIEDDKATKWGWKCLRCGEKYLHKRDKPKICENPNCGKKGPFKPFHPNEHYEIGDAITEEFHIRTIMESISGGRKSGRIFIRTNGVFEDERAIGFI